jgi:hypothetical protein
MLHERPLAFLPAYVAAARARGRPTRLVLRNTERVGLVHLYFYQGRLTLVEGHRGAGTASLADLATWQSGTIRQDELDAAPAASMPDPQLEAALADALRQLEARQIVGRSTPPGSEPHPITRPSAPRLPAVQPGMLRMPGAVSVPGLPPLPDRAMSEAATQRTPATSNGSGSDITDAQWQFLTRTLHQIVERASQEVAEGVAIGMLMQAVSRITPAHPFLAGIEVDERGWLHARHEGYVAHFARQDIVRALAALIGEYQTRCSLVLGPGGAQRVVADVVEPVRGPLASLGLDVAPA